MPGWQTLTATALSEIIAKRLERKRPGGWLPATVRLHLRRLADQSGNISD